ncbi:hypothetical protein, partial [Parvimonas micra]|uniref:hypothetical protein n=1 Tax=Parvimonas micra TaxID=33033 RepID=UPI002B49BE75
AGKKTAATAKSNPGEKLETGAKDALKTVEVNADKAEHAIVNTVKGAGKSMGTKDSAPKKNDGNKGPSFQQSMNTFGKNAEK